jgi:CDP-glucose 4,6-dehydratase
MIEDAAISQFDDSFFQNKKVFITGHTGFKGSWLCLWLHSLGAVVTGYALDPPTAPSLFEICRIDKFVASVKGDVRDGKSLAAAMSAFQPEIVIHMAAQSLVRESYKLPVETYATNVMGTVNLLEAARTCKTVQVVVNVTSDKCYENREWVQGYREEEPLGGYDPYSSSKACSELVTSAYRNSFFHSDMYASHGVGVSTARAGNVIGGGDWAADRLVPDCVRALLAGEKIIIRNPRAIRPWQHVLESLSGYLLLAEKLYREGPRYSGAWNFGPNESDAKSVEWLVKRLCGKWGDSASYMLDAGAHPHEANYLKLDCSKAKSELGWRPRWDLEKAIDSVIEWTRVFKEGKDLTEVCLRQIKEYHNTASRV